MRGAEGIERSLIDYVYGGETEDPGEEMARLIGDVERFRTQSPQSEKKEEEEAAIEKRIRKELEKILKWCERTFGDAAWLDASEAWVEHSEEV